MQNYFRVLVLSLFFSIGIVTLINFIVNVIAIFLLGYTLRGYIDFTREDFEAVTSFMTAWLIAPESNVSRMDNAELFKVAMFYDFLNNLIVFLLAFLEAALLKYLKWLNLIPKLYKPASICFLVIALLTPIVFSVTDHFASW